MSGIAQELPSEAVGAAVGVFLYSCFCLSLSLALLWATKAHRELKSYVALLAFYTALSTVASMAQQIHTYLRWTSIKIEQFDYVRDNIGNPELSVAGPSVGIDLLFFYIQYYCYNAEAILTASWAVQLAYAIYQLQPTKKVGRYGSNAAKATAIVLPMFQVGLLRTKAVQENLVAFYFVANVIMGVSLAVGLVLLLAILAKYVSTQAEVSWHVQYGRSGLGDTGNSLATFSSASGPPLHQRSIYDNWLVIRFTIAFGGLAAYQLLIVAAEILFALNNNETLSEVSVNLTPKNAKRDFKNFLPGVSACILAFVVFGTTKAFRDYFYRGLVPRALRRKIRNRSSKAASMSLQLPQYEGSTVALRDEPGRTPRMPTPAGTGTAEFFELDGGVSGRGIVHELPTPTPTYQSTFDLHPKDDVENMWPGPNAKSHRHGP